MKDALKALLADWGVADDSLIYSLTVIGLIALVTALVHLAVHRVLLRALTRMTEASRHSQVRMFDARLASRLALAAQGVVVWVMGSAFLDPDHWALALLETVTHLWIVLFTVLALFALLDGVERLSRDARSSRRLPLRGLFQGMKLAGSIIGLIFAVGFLIGKSPLILFSGLGAMTAVVLLVFRDPILGLVAGIQLSANDMLSVGDWLEMPDYGADGDVVDISLTTVKVRNWDKTITSVPNYALVSNSFKNWRNIETVGGRRIKRSIRIEASSVGFASEQLIERLREAELLTEHIEEKLASIREENERRGIDPDSPTDARRLTNIGLLRAYLTRYLGSRKAINTDLTHMVRQLQAGDDGIPLELYAFSHETSWIPYENVQSEIFDHVYAVLPGFGLRLHQAPNGSDVRSLARSLTGADTENHAPSEGRSR
ncbi:mechanosensitive ion channel family protein [Wenzhouxiangella sp. XN79A]|uniref:mechanosensitive ion channel family protein n=1 Tax=Wenzhouxiangella sp. XN79A TaxID=2724193 RepID=UPI00144AAE66|nr:mechanosensitive ion channel family protein [Wenzhouxiangella sp. XN79A]NKI33666.1 mechanosensitive ion channel family protein [Wenzhouxiangella sp. XN79A]